VSSGHHRKLSHDSGAYELEDIAQCLIDGALSLPTREQRESSASSDTTDTLPENVAATDDSITTVSYATLSA